jgi:hypothetical protein
MAVSGADEVNRNRDEIKPAGGGREPAAAAGIGSPRTLSAAQAPPGDRGALDRIIRPRRTR